MTFRNLLVSLFAATVALTAQVGALAQPIGGVLNSAPASSSSPVAAPPSDAGSSAYVLGRDDVIEVGILGRSDFGGRARVQADGAIQLPLIGKVPAADKTASELSDTVRKALQAGGFFADPVVTVEVVSFTSRYVTVLGAVGTPGLVPINRPYRLSEILARVGGVRDGAADYLIVRSDSGQETRPLIRELSTGDLKQDPYVSAGDKIFAPAAELFYIYGQVNAAGAFPMQADMTVRMAVAKAGGLTESGSDKKITVNRAGKKVKLKLDEKIRPGDVMVVGERLF